MVESICSRNGSPRRGLFKIRDPGWYTKFFIVSVVLLGFCIIDLQGQSAFQFYQKGEHFFNRKEYQLSLEQYQKAVDLDPSFYNAWLKLGLAKSELNDHLGAISMFTVAIRLNPNKPITYYYRALSRSSINDFKHALKDCTKSIKLDPKNSNYLLCRAMAFTLIDDVKSAEKDFAKAIELDPLNYKGFEKRGIFRLMHNNLDGAKEDLLIATQLNGINFESNYYLALFYHEIGCPQESINCLRSIKGFGEERAKAILERYFDNSTYRDSLIKNNAPSGASSNEGFFIDERDKQEYRWINIGEQTWMAENLAYNPYNEKRHYVKDLGVFIFKKVKSTHYKTKDECWYNWTTSISKIDSTGGICPKGWHLPSEMEWTVLSDYIFKGSDLKSFYGWYDNGNGENWSGFNAQPFGILGNKNLDNTRKQEPQSKKKRSFFNKFTDGYFSDKEYESEHENINLVIDYWEKEKSANFWSSTPRNDSYAWAYNLSYLNCYLNKISRHKGYELSVRCIKD